MTIKKLGSLLLLPFSFLLLMAMISSSCATMAQSESSSKELPTWVNNPDEQFSNQQYLMAVGSAISRQEAKNQAHANLAKIFVSEVEVNENTVQEFEETSSSTGETKVKERTYLITDSNIESDQQMKNVQVKEVYEADNGTYYALAVMDRMKTSQLYTEEINRRQSAIKSFQKKATQTESKLEQLIYMKQALMNARMNKMLANQRAVLTSHTTQGIGEDMSVPAISQAYRDAKKECTVYIVGEEIPQEVSSTLNRQLQNEGFTISQTPENSVVEIALNLTMEPIDMGRKNAKFLQWSFQVEAQNRETGSYFSTYSARGREGGMNKANAKERTTQAIQQKISSEFPVFINEELLSIK
ncbi:LPP20 family lipoprotein [Fodinibius saliphilus]|uniref:LPP20 family lipoprotein n=1 Tax=Fodinibius saliphilus TaxID=1920650 RepID=UPI001486D92D|nr:LPP20 family lipoprotein [Fodinibius saliphilus]